MLDQSNQLFRFETTISDPAAGTDFSYTIPLPYLARILMVKFDFTASAAVANRLPRVVANDLVNDYYISGCPGIISASEVVQVVFSTGINILDLSNVGYISGPIGDDFVISNPYSLNSSILNIDAGDQISNVVIYYETIMHRVVNI